MAKQIPLSLLNERDYIDNAVSLGFLEVYPGFAMLLQKYRERFQATKTQHDVKVQNDRDYFALIDACNNNYIFYLIVTKQDYLLYHYLKDPELLEEFAAYLHKERNHERHANQNTNPVLNKPHSESSNIRQQELDFSWLHPDSNLSNIEKLQHYDSELKRITFNYYIAQTNIYVNSLHSSIRHINNLIEALDVHDPNDRPAIEQLTRITNKYQPKIEELENRQVHRADGSPDLEAAAEQTSQIKLLREQMDQEVDQFYAQNSALNRRINASCLEYQAAKFERKEQIQQATIQYEQQKEELLVHLEKTLLASKTELMEKVNTLIETLENCPIDTNNREQVREHKNLINTLNQLNNNLDSTQDFDLLQRIIGQCNIELKKSANWVNNLLPEDSAIIYQDAAQAINKMLITTDLMPEPSAPNVERQHFIDSPAADNFEPSAPDISLMNDEIAPSPPPTYGLEPSAPDASLMNDDVGQSPPSYESTLSPEEVPHSSEIESAPIPSVVRNRYAFSYANGHQNAQPLNADSDSSNEAQQEFTKIKKAITRAWKAFKIKGDFSETQQELVGNTDNLISHISRFDSYQDLTQFTLNSLLDSLDKLEAVDGKIFTVKRGFEELSTFFKNNEFEEIHENSMAFRANP